MTVRQRATANKLLLLLAAILARSVVAESPTAPAWSQRLSADWVLAEEVALLGTVSEPVTTQADAAGGCDGVKNGEWGFHTDDSENPWWQVDLGKAEAVERVVIWNRREAPQRASRIKVLLSDDGKEFRQVYQHDGTVFQGFTDKKPLVVKLKRERARYVRLVLPGKSYFHLDEVEVFGPANPKLDLALHRPADQISVSQWSVAHNTRPVQVDWAARARHALTVCEQLEREPAPKPPPQLSAARLAVQAKLDRLPAAESAQPLFLEARRLQRQLALRNPLLRDFDTLLFTKRVPGSFNHMSDQYYGWWSKPGGGIYRLLGLTTDAPAEECLTTSFKDPGSFLRPTLSYDAKKVLFAWCRYYPHLAAETNKLNKANVPADAFYHLFEMNLDGSGARQITQGKYDDFDGRYLPDGRIVFLSTRRGQSLQVGRASAARTVTQPDMPDCYVRCGGGPERPVAVYTLHTVNADGSGLCAISPFEMFEWTPEIAPDGRILHSRWDYIDRDNMPYMGLWAINPDGSDPRIVFKNYTRAPHCVFEAKPIPGSHKIVFTASGHHSQTMGSLVLLDPSTGVDGPPPMTRLTPEVCFPEIEGWPLTSYANPWPLSERFYLVAWGREGREVPGPEGWSRWHAVQRPSNGMALYLYDAATHSRELLWADGTIACGDPIPVRPRERPPVIASQLAANAPSEGRFLLADVYRGLNNVPRGEIKALRLVAVPAKTHPTMNYPSMGITHDDPGKCVLGTVPVEADGSAYFHAPAGVIVFFQALDARGVAVQTMRSVTHVQPGQTLSCIGCHEHRQQAPPVKPALAAGRAPSSVVAGPEGSWPLRFDRLVQPVLEARCVSCHSPQATNAIAAKLDLTPAKAYATLVAFGKPSLQEQVSEGYRRGFSVAGEGIAQKSALLTLLDAPGGHYDVQLDGDSRERLWTWMDTYAQRLGCFSDEQERDLVELRRASVGWLRERKPSHRFACADYSQGKVFVVSRTGEVEWEYQTASCNDLWVLPSGNLLFNTGHGVKEVTRDKRVVFDYQSKSEIYACQRLANGNTFIGECNSGRLLEVEPSGHVAKEIRLLPEGKDGGHLYMRNARRLENGHYLVTHYGEQVVREYDSTGQLVLSIPAAGGPHSVARLPNGHTLISCGDLPGGSRVFEVDMTGQIVWQVKNGDLPGISLKFVAGFQRLPNGNTVVANWLGHGQFAKAPHLLELTPDKRVVWTFANHEATRTVASVQLLDGPGDAGQGPLWH